METIIYRDILKSELSNRKIVNPSYSLRAFARDLGVAPPVLSSVMNGKKGFSADKARKIAMQMKLDKEQAELFITSAGLTHSRSKKEREEFLGEVEKIQSRAKKYTKINLDYFKVISDWYHFAILELTYLKNFKPEICWIANTLGITEQDASDAIKRLIKLDLLSIKNGQWTDTFKFLATPDDIPSNALKKFHTQLLQKSINAVHEQNVEDREYGSHIIAIDKNDLPKLKEHIREFSSRFEMLASKSNEKSHVYCMGVQLYNLTKDNI